MKHLLPVFIVLIFTQLLISCGDSSSESGTLGRSSPPKSLSLIAKNSKIHSRSSECQSVASDGTSKVPYINYPINKVLFRCDSKSGNQLFSWSGRSESTKVLVRWAREFCADDYGSSATIIDVNNAYCKSNSSASNSSTDPFEGYVNKYPDLVSAYNANSQGLSKSNWGKNHYCAVGLAEGRAYPGISIANCRNSNSTGASSGNAVSDFSVDDYRWVYQINARHSQLEGGTVRWPTSQINVSGVTHPVLQAAIREWRSFSFNFNGSGQVRFAGYRPPAAGLPPTVCGWAQPAWLNNGVMRSCTITLSSEHWTAGIPQYAAACIKHEMGHCLGILGHTSDGGIMDASINSTRITPAVRKGLRLLYSLPPGTKIGSMGRALNPDDNLRTNQFHYDRPATRLIIGPRIPMLLP